MRAFIISADGVEREIEPEFLEGVEDLAGLMKQIGSEGRRSRHGQMWAFAADGTTAINLAHAVAIRVEP